MGLCSPLGSGGEPQPRLGCHCHCHPHRDPTLVPTLQGTAPAWHRPPARPQQMGASWHLPTARQPRWPLRTPGRAESREAAPTASPDAAGDPRWPGVPSWCSQRVWHGSGGTDPSGHPRWLREASTLQGCQRPDSGSGSLPGLRTCRRGRAGRQSWHSPARSGAAGVTRRQRVPAARAASGSPAPTFSAGESWGEPGTRGPRR